MWGQLTKWHLEIQKVERSSKMTVSKRKKKKKTNYKMQNLVWVSYVILSCSNWKHGEACRKVPQNDLGHI